MHLFDRAECPVQFEDQHDLKFPFGGGVEETLPGGAVGHVQGRGRIDILPVYISALGIAEVP
jgi:hypothetical protein